MLVSALYYGPTPVTTARRRCEEILARGAAHPVVEANILCYLGGEALVALVVEDSHTCYLGERDLRHGWGYGCGTCPACELREKGWEAWVDEGRPAMTP